MHQPVDDCAARWAAEIERLVMYRRQYARLADEPPDADDDDDPIEQAKGAVADAERLVESIAQSRRLMDDIEDEHNAHTEGTWTHAQRQPVSA